MNRSPGVFLLKELPGFLNELFDHGRLNKESQEGLAWLNADTLVDNPQGVEPAQTKKGSVWAAFSGVFLGFRALKRKIRIMGNYTTSLRGYCK